MILILLQVYYNRIMTFNLLEKSILATIGYYNVLDYPLTGLEVFRYLISPLHIIAQSEIGQKSEIEPISKISFLDILVTLKNPVLSNFIEEYNGFYFLKNRKKIVKIRIERQKISDQKWKKAIKIIKWLQIIPYLKMIAVSGSLALDNAKEQSDIDLLIVAKHKRIWTVRFLIIFFLHFFGKRRHGKKTKNRACLNHYITDNSLEIKFPSLYNAQTYAHLVVILETEPGIFEKFYRANKWISSFINTYPFGKNENQKTIRANKILRFIAKTKEFFLNNFIGDFFELLFGAIQKFLIKYHSKKDKGEGRVVIEESQLEFHPASPEAEVLERYNNIMVELGLRARPEKDSGLQMTKN